MSAPREKDREKKPVIDACNRKINYLRISVTDRCNLRCIYCMPPQGVEWLAHEEILTLEEILAVCRASVSLGIKNFKLTGGEPLVRKGFVDFVQNIKSIPGVETVTMTTNGQIFAGLADDLRKAGLDGVNISLDTCNPQRYAQITRGGSLEATLGAVDAALRVGIPSVKINCVPMRGQDLADLFALADLAKNKPISVRFIEVMPIGNGQCFETVPNDDIKQILESKLGVLKPIKTKLGNGPSEYCKPEGFSGHIGFISAVSHSFCERCNRVRLTSNGFLKLCLNYDSGVDLRKILRGGVDDANLADIMKNAIANKPSGHKFSAKHRGEGEEHDYMSQIGG